METVRAARRSMLPAVSRRNVLAKGRMILPQGFVKEALIEVHNGPAGGHLERIKTLSKIKPGFGR